GWGRDRRENRAARAWLRAAVARWPQGAAGETGFPAGAARPERAGRDTRKRRDRRSLSQSADGADLPRYRLRHRVRRPHDGSGSGRPEVPELARDVDLLQEPNALRP